MSEHTRRAVRAAAREGQGGGVRWGGWCGSVGGGAGAERVGLVSVGCR